MLSVSADSPEPVGARPRNLRNTSERVTDMNRIVRAFLLALPLFALAPSSARAVGWDGGWPYKIEGGANVYLHVHKYPYGATGGQLGPWYLYWPMEAHFMPQAPLAYGAWPQPMGLPQQFNPPLPSPQPHFTPPAPTAQPQFTPPGPTPLPQFRPPVPQQLPQFQPPRPSPLPDNGNR